MLLGSFKMRPKDMIQACKQTGLVYSIPCKDCETKYIGETGRSLETKKKNTREVYGWQKQKI